MGVGRNRAIVEIGVIKGATTLATRRAEMADFVAAGQEWLARWDAQVAAAKDDFAAAQPALFASFVQSLSDPVVAP